MATRVLSRLPLVRPRIRNYFSRSLFPHCINTNLVKYTSESVICRSPLIFFNVPRRFAIVIQTNLITSVATSSKREKQEKELQKQMRLFFLKVHPDLFTNFPSVHETNTQSLQILNSLIDLTKQSRIGTKFS
jgi:hypothetical protein